MESELLWLFDDNMVSCCIPPDHMMVLGTLEETIIRKDKQRREGRVRD